MSLQLTIPEEVERALRLPDAAKEPTLLRELALALYEKGMLSFGKARTLSGLSKWAFDDLLTEHGIVRHYNEASLDEDIAYGQS